MATTIAPLNQMIKKRKLMQRRSLSISLTFSLSLAGIYLSDRRRGTDLPRSDNHDGDMADVTAKLHSSKNGNFSARKDPVYIN